MTDLILTIIAAFLMLPGLAGVIVPLLPGVPFMFVVALGLGILTHFRGLEGQEVWYLAILVVVSILVDYLSGILGAKFGGASLKALGWGTLGFIIGLIFLPPLGGLIGMFLGILIAEAYLLGRAHSAMKAATGGVLGAAVGLAVNLILALIFIGLFLYLALT